MFVNSCFPSAEIFVSAPNSCLHSDLCRRTIFQSLACDTVLFFHDLSRPFGDQWNLAPPPVQCRASVADPGPALCHQRVNVPRVLVRVSAWQRGRLTFPGAGHKAVMHIWTDPSRWMLMRLKVNWTNEANLCVKSGPCGRPVNKFSPVYKCVARWPTAARYIFIDAKHPLRIKGSSCVFCRALTVCTARQTSQGLLWESKEDYVYKITAGCDGSFSSDVAPNWVRIQLGGCLPMRTWNTVLCAVQRPCTVLYQELLKSFARSRA